MQTSTSTAKLDAALAAAQGEFSNPERNRTVNVVMKGGGSYSFDYSTFDCILDMARPILTKHKISVTQWPTSATHTIDAERSATTISVTTRVAHDGEFINSTIGHTTQHGGALDIQDCGGILSYLKRYSFCAALGIEAEYDTDGPPRPGSTTTFAAKEPPPDCPKCGHNKHVYKSKDREGEFFCWKAKGGCGENFGKPGHAEGSRLVEQAQAQQATQTAAPATKAPRGRKEASAESGVRPARDPQNAIDPSLMFTKKMNMEEPGHVVRWATFAELFQEGLAVCDEVISDGKLRAAAGQWVAVNLGLCKTQEQLDTMREWYKQYILDGEVLGHLEWIHGEQSKVVSGSKMANV